ncbi:MAG: ATP-binding cassette domain-containing protein, partial [Acidobacteriia bacterium]|nr:ATP-binding cassette domain-containing protein [Terriglobia bacterium]
MPILPPPNPVLQSRFQGSASLRTGCSVSFKSSKAPNGHLPDRCFRHLSSPASFTTELCAPSGPELGPLYSTFTHTRRPAFLLLASLWYGSPNSERGGIPRVRRQRLLVVVPFVAFGPFSAFHESQVYRSVPARRSTRLLDGFGTNQSLKTTVVKLMTRLYDPVEGQVLLDGVDLREYNLEDLYREIGVIFQDFMRYEMTARENIAVGRIDDINNMALLKTAADKSMADEVIERLPRNYEQMLGRRFESGVDLSGGEWQKIALARAYLRDAQVLILDEPTAALDARSEFEVFQRFAELTAGKSALFISHRFSTVRMADRIVVLENGRIAEDGN